ncbi:MAG: hypothetical protein QXJ68_03805 [Methanocellales archaeon]
MKRSSLSLITCSIILIFFIVILSLCITQSFAQPSETVKFEGQAKVVPLPSYNLIPMVVGNGFAFSGDEFHVVKLNVIGIRKLAFQDLRSMIAERKNLSQIKEALVKPEGITPVWKGYLKFGTKHFSLKVEEIDSKHLKAQVLSIPSIVESAKTPIAIGNISMEIKFYEGTIVGIGNITFDSEAIENNYYDVYLYISPDRPYLEPLLKSVIKE